MPGRSTMTITISLPPAMVKEVEKVRKVEHRTRSELVREALRTYFARFPVVPATAEERTAIARGRAEIARGDYVTLDQLDAVARPRRKVRGKDA